MEVTFWESVTKLFWFTGIRDVTVWQDVVISAAVIPIVLILINWLHNQLDSAQPAKSLLTGFLKNNSPILIFHSQMSGADNNWNFNPNQKYITMYPEPLPTDSSHLGVQKKHRIDPILSKAEADCMADVYNVLGRCGKVHNIVGAHLINDWDKWSLPIFTIGFNPKTEKLMKRCNPIYFKLIPDKISEFKIIDINHKVSYEAVLSDDAGVIQKTFVRGSKVPVFILAGLGTAGTAASGYVLAGHLVELGKLYGSSSFCVFLKVTTNEGKESAYIDKVYPKPHWYRVALYPINYYRFMKHNRFIR